MRIILAPMEGVLDHSLRELLCAQGGFDLCIGAFIRIIDQTLPKKVFLRHYPELNQGSQIAGVPVRVQLLGQNPRAMADNALQACEMGSPGVDLNFGCPAKNVNRSQGGAFMLQEPESIYSVVKAVRDAVPSHLPVSAKIRLGWDHSEDCLKIAQLIEAAGASELCVHGRTKVDGYRADKIDWQKIGEINRAIEIPVIANGEIWDQWDAQECLRQTGCSSLMIGRGALNLPNLARSIRGESSYSWQQTAQLLVEYAELMSRDNPEYLAHRCKQWLTYLRQQYSEAKDLFLAMRRQHDNQEFLKELSALCHGVS
ncbi:tRNA-dihydrouridine synthase [Dongshaea marina]|uniref:tRNA-dihydrouridine synthase n=1 Tax=Dongshaea marina TaxID=2047966 RepID=UPI000D3E92DD|nr:tRNA-dihydrouridine synthase [Dongshaea marina]